MSSKKERPTIEERVARSKKNAARELAKSGLIQIRMEPAVLEQIYSAAAEEGVRYTTLVRTWIMGSLSRKEAGFSNGSVKSRVPPQSSVLDEISELKNRVRNLERGRVMEPSAIYSAVDLSNIPTEDLLKELLSRENAVGEQRKRKPSNMRKAR